MKKTISKIVMVLAVATSFTACKKTDATTVDLSNNGSYKVVTSGSVTYVQNFVADTIQGYNPTTGQPIGATGARVFFSLERGEVVTDTATKTWDLAFNGTKIWINGGVSGNKMGGAYNKMAAFADVVSADDASMKVDGTSRAITGYDANAGTTSSNGGWYTLVPPPPGASIVTTVPGRTILVRTASGKYAKIEMMCYYKGGVVPTVSTAILERYYNFRYTYQANGSTTF